MKLWKRISGLVTAALAVIVGILCRDMTLVLVSQALALAGGITSFAASFVKAEKLRPANAALIVLYGLSFCVGIYGHAGLWLYTVSAICAVVCCLGACLSIALRR